MPTDTPAPVDSFVAWAVRRNPRLRAARAMAEAARWVPPQKRSLPDPTLGFGLFVDPVETRVGPQRRLWVLSQRFPFFGKLRLRGEVAERDAAIADAQAEAVRLDVSQRTKRAFWSYAEAVRVLAILEEERSVLERMEAVAETRYASGLVSQQDVLKAQLALSNLENERLLWRQRWVQAKARLAALLDLPPEAPLPPPALGGLPEDLPPLERLVELARRSRPELLATREGVEKARAQRALARREFFPDFSVGVQWIQVGDGPLVQFDDNGQDAWAVRFGMNLPLQIGRRKAAVAEAAALESKWRHESEAVAVEIDNAVEEAYRRTRWALDQVRLYRSSILPQAEQTFRASEAGYRTGRVDFLNFLDSERMWLEAKRMAERAIARFGQSLADLERSVGIAGSLTELE
jgi:outer membrane protein TolC